MSYNYKNLSKGSQMKNNSMITICMENTKMGPIPSFSILPKVTCNMDASCTKKGCYAWTMARRRRNVYLSWAKNTKLVQEDMEQVKKQLHGWLLMYSPMAFRIHVGGDFFSVEYLDMWRWMAQRHPKVKFFAFTKQFEVLSKSLAMRGKLPKNLSIILSAWTPDTPNWCPPIVLRKKFPVAWIVQADVKGNTKRSDMAMITSVNGSRQLSKCSGLCCECGRCFNMKRKDGDIYFVKH